MQRIAVVASATSRGLGQVLAGPAPFPVWSRRPPTERRAGYAALAAATLALGLINATTVHAVSAAADTQLPASWWQVLLAFVVVLPLPLPLAARDPMLAWRVGWLALLLTPLLPAQWWGGWPWGPPQVLALLGVFCLAAVGQRRAAL